MPLYYLHPAITWSREVLTNAGENAPDHKRGSSECRQVYQVKNCDYDPDDVYTWWQLQVLTSNCDDRRMPTLFILQAQAYKRREWGISTQVYKTGLTTREALQVQRYPAKVRRVSK